MTQSVPPESPINQNVPLSTIKSFWKRLIGLPQMRRKNRQQIKQSISSRTGNKIPLTALTPHYQPEHHEVYVDLLKRALRHPNTRNVALTGSYGSGKSSVLQALRKHWWQRRRIIELSLSTLDPDLAPPAQDQNPAEREKSNQIQKELVKQLLYRLPPAKTPRSRFPRASKPTWRSGLLVATAAVTVVALAWTALVLFGVMPTIKQRLEDTGWPAPWFWGIATIAFVVVALAGWWNLAGKYAVQAGLKTGALTISLEPTASSYFDQYLDEIMYFFQISKARVVLIEDVDRFGDAVVFDTLRALNTLVNSSRQVGRRVIFVYAIRDSVLGQLGSKEKYQGGDPKGPSTRTDTLALEIDKANRAKYFDVIIPIVPFVTVDNARDLMMKTMRPHVAEKAKATGISPALIRLAARHVADMRTLISIRNEFEIHLDRLMTSARFVVPDINHDIIFSLVLLRATAPDAYEKIRLQTSPLDKITERWIRLVDANLEAQTKRLTDLRTQLEKGQSLSGRLERAAKLLDTRRDELLDLAAGTEGGRVEFSGPLTDADLANLAGWQQIASGQRQSLTLYAKPDRYGQVQRQGSLTIGRSIVARLIGMSINPESWREADLVDIREQIEETQAEIMFLRHHTWKQLYTRQDLTVVFAGHDKRRKRDTAGDGGQHGEAGSENTPVSFADLVDTYAPTGLACDLIAHGYLPRHFARYSSMFYGDVVGLNAAEYISRAIEPGEPIIEYELDGAAIEQILIEQHATSDDADLFDDLSIYNLDILDYLIVHRSNAAQRVAHHLATRWNDLEQRFIERYFQRSSTENAVALASMMAPRWRHALQYTTLHVQVTPETRQRLVNAVLGELSEEEQESLTDAVGSYLTEHCSDLTAVKAPGSSERAAIVMATLAAAEATVLDLTPLNEDALAAATQLSIYPVTPANLVALGGAEEVALDVLRRKPEPRPVYRHMLNHLGTYFEALQSLDPSGHPIIYPADFADVLNDVASVAEGTSLDQLLRASSEECRVADLENAMLAAWPALAVHDRTDPTFANIQRYVAEHGLDEAIGGFLVTHGRIETPEEAPLSERISLAAPILAAREEIPSADTRVGLVVSLSTGVLPITHVTPKDGDLIGPLLAKGLLADDPDTFGSERLSRWEDLKSAILESEGFEGFVDSTILPAKHLPAALKPQELPSTKQRTLIDKLASLVEAAAPAEATAVTEELAERSEQLDLSRMEALQAAGASTPSLVRLFAVQDGIAISELRSMLLAMQGDYQRLAQGGSGVVGFSDDDHHRVLLSRLNGVTHTGAKIRATLKHGKRLEADLKQAP